MAKTTIMEADGKVIITTELDMSKLDETVAKLIETTVTLAGNALVASVLEWLHLRISEVVG